MTLDSTPEGINRCASASEGPDAAEAMQAVDQFTQVH